MLVCMQKINFITHFFIKTLQRNSRLVILGNFGMPAYTPKIIVNVICSIYLKYHGSETKKQNVVMKTYKELLGTCIKSKKAYINTVCIKSASKDSLNCFAIFGSSACQGQHVFSMSFLTCTAP